MRSSRDDCTGSFRSSSKRQAGQVLRFEPLEPRVALSADVLTYHNNNMRTGDNPFETVLTPANVNVAHFGKVGEVRVDGAVYAQPLYKSSVRIPGKGVHDVVYVATEHDSLYAFDAHSLALLWHDSFIDPAAGVTPIPSHDTGAYDVTPELGITGTPVIDPATNAIYLVASIKLAHGRSAGYAQELYAVDLGTGRQKAAPAVIHPTVPGTGVGSFRHVVGFNPLREFQRPGLLLDGGVVYVGWASHGDIGPYHGWLVGYNAQNLAQVTALNITPNGSDGGIWMSGGAPAADAGGRIYVATGNGTFGTRNEYGDTLLKLAPGSLAVLGSFTPHNQAALNAIDQDFGSGGVLLLPDQPGAVPHELITAGKAGTIYLINRDQPGGYSPRGDNVVEEVPNALLGSFDTPAYFNGAVYYVGTGSRLNGPEETLKEFRVVAGRLVPTPVDGNIAYGYPGATPSISSNGASHGIVWTLDTGQAAHQGPAILRAYSAANIRHELYDSTMAGARDTAGPAVKFTVPTVANGRVYVGGNGTLTVYGLRGH